MTVAYYRPNVHDVRWFAANPARPWRVRRAIDGAEPPPFEVLVGREPAVAVMKTRHGVVGVPAPLPYPDEAADPWITNSRGLICRVRDYYAALQRADALAPDSELGLPDRTAEYDAHLARFPDRVLREAVTPPSESVPPELHALFAGDDLSPRAALLRACYETVYRAATESDPDAGAYDEVDLAATVARVYLGLRFIAEGRRVEKPSRALVDFLLKGDYPVRDDVPFVPPSGAYLIDVTDAPLRFAHFDEADTAFVHVNATRAPRFRSAETETRFWNALKGFGAGLGHMVGAQAVGRYATEADREVIATTEAWLERAFALARDACNVPEVAYGFLSAHGAIETAYAVMDGVDSWTDAFEIVNAAEDGVSWRDAGRLVYGLAYLRQVRLAAKVPEPRVVPPNPKIGGIYPRQPRDNAVELPQYRILGGAHPTAAEPKRDHLIEGTTVRREHTRTQRYGKGLAESKVITIEKNERVKVWVRPDRDPNAPKRTRLRLNRAGAQALREEEKKA